jgi:MATE family multidrug resistance protein
MVANVALNWVLIFGNLGLPAMGVTGAALASSIATLLGFVFLLTCFLLGVGQSTRAMPRLAWAELGQMLKIGIPSGLNWFVEFTAFSFFVNVVVAGLGTSALAAMMAVLQLNSISFMPAFALASAGAIFVGQAIGAKRHDDVGRTVRLTFGAAAAWQGAVGLAYLLVPTLLFSVFLKEGADQSGFLEVGVRILMLSAAWQLFDAASMVVAEALRAAGDTAFTFWVRAGIAWGVFAPGAWWSVHRQGAGDVVAAAWLLLYLVLLAIAMFLRFRSGRWRSIDIGVV